MAIYSRALKHIDMNRVKELREEKIENKRIIEQCRNEIRQELLNAHNPEYSNWRHEVQNLDENMTSSGLFLTILQGQGDIDLIDVAADSTSWPIENNNEASNSFGSGSGGGTLGGFVSESGAMIQIGGETAWNSAATSSALDLSRVDTIRVQGIAGNNSNGGIAPVGDLEVYFYTADLNSVSSTQVAIPKTATSLTNFEVTIPEGFRGENMKVSFFTDTYDSGQGIHYKPFTIPINGLNHATIGSIPVGAGSATGVNNFIAGKVLGDRSDENMRSLGYYLWQNIQRAKNGADTGPNPNYGQPGEGEFIFLDNWDPAPISGGVNSVDVTDADHIHIGRTVYDMFKGNKLYGLSEVSFRRRNPMSLVVALDDPEATAFIRTDPYFEGLTPEEKKKKLEEMLKAGDEYLLKMFGEDFPGSGNTDIVGPGVDVTTWTGETPDLNGQAGVDHITDVIGLAVSGFAGVGLAKAGLGAAVNKLTQDITSKFVKSGLDLNKWINKGKNERIPNEDNASWFELVVDDLQQAGKFDGGKGGIIPKNMQQLKDLFKGDGGITWSFTKGRGTGPTPIQRQLMRRGGEFTRFLQQLTGKDDVKEQTEPKNKKTIKKPKEFFNKADIKPVFPETPPPKMIKGRHPDWVDGEKVSNRYNRLDPISAKAMPPTGNPHIDKKVRAAAKKPK